MKFIKPTLLMVVILLLFSFSLFNGQPVKVRFFVWQSPELPLFLILLFDFALGFAIAFLWGAIRSTSRSQSSRAKKAAKGGEEEANPRLSASQTKPPASAEDNEK